MGKMLNEFNYDKCFICIIEENKKEKMKESDTIALEKHYDKRIQPIEVMEQIAELENIPSNVSTNFQQAVKYMMRAGEKGQFEEDVKKAYNYIHRAYFGEFPNG